MIVWGGFGSGYPEYLNSGGRYCAAAPALTPTPTPAPSTTASPTPTPIGTATATPTASPTPTPPCINDTWNATSTVNAPDVRAFHTALWTGAEMIVWGGENLNNNQVNTLNTGGRYNPATHTSTPTSTPNAPIRPALHAPVWTPSRKI